MSEERTSNSLGLLLRDLLQERSLSMRQLSELTEIDTATISRISNGKRNATLDHLQKFADSLDVPMQKLVEAAGYPFEGEEIKKQSDIHMSVDMIQGFLESSNVYKDNFSIEQVEEKLTDYELYVQTEEGGNTILKGFEEKIQSVSGIGPFITQLKELFSKYRERQSTPYELTLIGSALLYFIIPVDVIPDYIFPIGYLDDAIAVKLVVKSLSNRGVTFDT
ncbi:DUF1232 domain-containing protein [Sporosarcina sp. G11-34]|uniref:DUF1232 domain-containing protein n=1 Tax=Sporosarcina sp. G11-34 TaxID=2849605 RepID=UPI0022A9A1F6|nr:DUF1232 domain-containing protein [Sporosarcina sp. G11-34]MCZ2258121.1 DUF1232 domain-containing protein [Sporosarcina sp. G11-34]